MRLPTTKALLFFGAISAAMLAAAHSFERLMDLPPCILCLKQREAYWLALAVCAAGLIAKTFHPRATRWALFGVSAAFAYGLVMAGYHVGVEQGWWAGPAGCSTVTISLGDIDLTTALDQPVTGPSCADIAWQFLGLSMAAWNGIILVGLVAASLSCALKGQYGR